MKPQCYSHPTPLTGVSDWIISVPTSRRPITTLHGVATFDGLKYDLATFDGLKFPDPIQLSKRACVLYFSPFSNQ
jgi:hypothetical protein